MSYGEVTGGVKGIIGFVFGGFFFAHVCVFCVS